MKATWTRDKKSGDWKVIAAAAPGESLPAAGDEITVTKKNKDTQTVIADSVSKSFTGRYGATAGQQCCFVTTRSNGNGNGNGNGYRERRYSGPARYCWECGGTHTGGIGDECGG